LHGVLVHSGGLDAGHYYAFLKPTKDGDWYRFDDDRVNRVTEKEVLEENYGGEYENANGGVRQPYTRTYSTKRSMNAYMLVYVRKTRSDDVLLPIEKDDVPAHIGMIYNEFQILPFPLLFLASSLTFHSFSHGRGQSGDASQEKGERRGSPLYECWRHK
jgi:hypothetical protein